MASEAQVSANRRNAGKSTGPRTTQGKAVVAQNAIKHGLLARQNVIRGEDPQEFELCRRQLLGELVPVGHMETMLAERVVSLSWRIKRAERLQNEVFDYLMAREIEDSLEDYDDPLSPADEEAMKSDPETDPHLAVGRAIMRDYSNERVLDRLAMYERRIESSLYRTMKELQNRRLLREIDPPMEKPTPEPHSAGQDGPSCETKPIPGDGADGGHSPPARVADEPLCKTNPISQAADTLTGGDCFAALAMTETGEGPTMKAGSPGADDPACETKPICGGFDASLRMAPLGMAGGPVCQTT